MVQLVRQEPYHFLTLLQIKISRNRVISIAECLFSVFIKFIYEDRLQAQSSYHRYLTRLLTTSIWLNIYGRTHYVVIVDIFIAIL